MARDLIILARPVQWIKNGVVLAALVFAGEVLHTDRTANALLATLIFCLLSSAVYVFNDLIDRDRDRAHPLKKERPLASGRVSVSAAVGMMTVLLVFGALGSMYLGATFSMVAGAYVLVNGLYTLILKNVVIVDVMTIAFGFVIRALAGSVAIGVPASHWLFIMTLLLAMFLGFGKRRHELLLLEDGATDHRKSLDRYSPYLLDQCMGVTTASVVVMYLWYTLSPEVTLKLGTDYLYLTVPFVVYGIFRYLYLVHREAKGGSPTHILLTDRPILLTVALWLAAVITILYVL